MKNRPTPLTDKFLHDLRERMANSQPKIRKSRLADLLGISRVCVQRWFNSTGQIRKPNGEFILRIQELIKRNFTNMFL